MRLLIFIFSVSVIFSSCSNPYSKEIGTIDSLLVSLESAKVILHDMDTGLVYKRIKICSDNMQFILDRADTVNKEQALFMNDYANCKKTYTKMAQKLPALFGQFETIPMQLENLKRDLSRNLISEEEAKKFVRAEHLATEGIITTTQQLSNGMPQIDELFNLSHEKILHLIQSLDTTKEVNTES